MLPDGVRRLFRLLRGVKDVAGDVDEEIRFHLDEKVAALVARGMSPDAARAEALRQFGDVGGNRQALVEAGARHAARRAWLDGLDDWWLDIRHAARGLRRAPGLTAAVVLMLALGIGANAAMFGILDRLLLRPPPHVARPDLLVRPAIVRVWAGRPPQTGTLEPYARVAEYARGVPAFGAIAGYEHAREAVGDGDHRVQRAVVTDRFFDVLGAPAAIGRVLDSSDAAGPPVAVLSYRFWQREFDGDRSVLGQDLMLDRIRHAIVGVMPRGFAGAEVNAADVWTLLAHSGRADWRTQRGTGHLEVIGRLRDRSSRAAAIAQIAAVRYEGMSEQTRRTVSETVLLNSIIPGRSGSFVHRPARLAFAVGIVATLLFLITVANVANLLLVRAVARRRESAVRAALGAGRGRLLRAALCESLLLAALGGLAAGAVGVGAGRALRAFLLPDYHWATPPLESAAAVVAALLVLVTGVATGLVPASVAGSHLALGALRAGVQSGRGGRGRVRTSLVALQAAVSCALLVGTGLFVRSLVRAVHEDRGLVLDRMIYAPVRLPGGADARATELDALLADLRHTPGVENATVTTAAPMRGLQFATVHNESRDSSLFTMRYGVAADFFMVAGARVLGGRGFTADDRVGAEPVAVVDSLLAEGFWPAGHAVGRCLYRDDGRDCLRVVGVVAHVRATGLLDQLTPQLYQPLAQLPAREGYDLLVRATDHAERTVAAVGTTIVRHVPDYVVTRVRSYDALLAPELRPWRVGVILFAGSAALALLLSGVGIYAVAAFAVRQRTHELGVRRALGAPGRHIVRLVLGEALGTVGTGAVLGLTGAALAARFVAPLLYDVAPRDPIVLGASGVTLLAAGTVAALGAGVLALRVDPRRALEAE